MPNQIVAGSVVNGCQVKLVLGQNRMFSVFTTEDGQLRWNYGKPEDEVPDEKQLAISIFDELLTEIRTEVPAKSQELALHRLGKALFQAVTTISTLDIDVHFKSVRKYIDTVTLREARLRYVIAFLLSCLAVETSLLIADAHTEGMPINEYFWLATAGVAGSAISVLSRSSRLPLDKEAGVTLTVIQGGLRPLLGALFAEFALIAYKGDLAFSFAKDHPYALIAIAWIAGFSERLVPEMMSHLEGVP